MLMKRSMALSILIISIAWASHDIKIPVNSTTPTPKTPPKPDTSLYGTSVGDQQDAHGTGVFDNQLDAHSTDIHTQYRNVNDDSNSGLVGPSGGVKVDHNDHSPHKSPDQGKNDGSVNGLMLLLLLSFVILIVVLTVAIRQCTARA